MIEMVINGKQVHGKEKYERESKEYVQEEILTIYTIKKEAGRTKRWFGI